jgi:hypothetical protein
VSPNAVDPRLSAPYRLYFWPDEDDELPHVHVESSDGSAEFWLDPVGAKDEGSYNGAQRRKAGRMVERFRNECLEAWSEFDERRQPRD